MQALIIGQTYIDVTFLTDRMPTGDEKHVASAYAVSFGGNAVTAAFCCAKLSIVPGLVTSVADDWLGRMFLDMAAKYGIPVHARRVGSSSLSFIMPKDGKRAIVRCRDGNYLNSFPVLDLAGCRVLHVDGHQPDVLEVADLIRRRKSGRTVSCRLNAAPLQEAQRWLACYERFWSDRLDALARYLAEEASDGPLPTLPHARDATTDPTPNVEPRPCARHSSGRRALKAQPRHQARAPGAAGELLSRLDQPGSAEALVRYGTPARRSTPWRRRSPMRSA